jgi:hypothetical protein
MSTGNSLHYILGEYDEAAMKGVGAEEMSMDKAGLRDVLPTTLWFLTRQ